MEVIEKIVIKNIVPARSFYYLYAYTEKKPFFIYAHRDRVSFFATHEADSDISRFQDTVTKLTAIKYFNEKSDRCVGNIAKVNFDVETDEVIFIGTCLVSYEIKENLKADVWVNNKNKTVEFHLKNANEFKNNLDSEIILPDNIEEYRIAAKNESFEQLKQFNNEKLVTLVKEQSEFFKSLVSIGYKFTPRDLKELSEDLDWIGVSLNNQIDWTSDLISEFSENLNWEFLITNNSIHWSQELIERFSEKINWESLSKSTAILWTESFIEKYANKLSWREISRNESIKWDQNFIIKYKNKLNIESLSGNISVPWNIELIELLKSEIKNWNYFSSNKGSFWTHEIIEKYVNEINWNYSDNPSIPLSFPLVEKHLNKISWTNASKNPNLPWTEDIIEKYKEQLAFGWLSENPGLPWSFQLIEKYKDKWNWDNLGSNFGVPWTEKFIEDNLEKFQRFNGTCSLWSNTNLPKNENFWIKHKDLLFPQRKGTGLMKVIDAQNNDSIPVSVNFLFAIKDNIDWSEGDLFKTLRRTGKFKVLIDEISYDLMKEIVRN